MKILYIFNQLEFSGAELMYIQAAPVLIERGYEIHAIAAGNEIGSCADTFQQVGFIVNHVPIGDVDSVICRIKYVTVLSEYIRKNKIDIVHCQVNRLYFVSSWASHQCGVKCIYSVNNMFDCSFIRKPYNKLLRTIAKKTFKCRFHSGSDTVYKHELEYWNNDTEIVYWWYDEHDYFPAQEGEKQIIRKELNIPVGTFVLMTAGGCSHIKRHSDIIKATKLIVKEIPNFLFMHLGKGALEEEEKKLAKELGVEDNIRFCGNQSDFRKYLISADVYTMTSTKEGLSNATIDALACGIPAVLYNVVGLCDYNITGDNTLQINESPNELANAVVLLYNDKKLREGYIKKGKDLVTNKYQASKNINILINTFYQ